MFDLYSDVLPKDWHAECKISMLMMTYEEANIGYSMGKWLNRLLLGNTYKSRMHANSKFYLVVIRYSTWNNFIDFIDNFIILWNCMLQKKK